MLSSVQGSLVATLYLLIVGCFVIDMLMFLRIRI